MTDSAAPHTGTTIVGCVFNGGVVLGADGRVSTGQYISNRASNKIAPLSDSAFLLRSGSAADTQIISDYGGILPVYCALSPIEYQTGPRTGPSSIYDSVLLQSRTTLKGLKLS